jgi:hypothetical protein
MTKPEDAGAPAVGALLERHVRPCATERDSWDCPNMREVEGDTSMTHEHYACAVCGRRMALDYDEMR